MPNNRYQRGAAFERKVLKELIECGFFGIRAAGSHSPADLMVSKCVGNQEVGFEADVFLVQCKTNGKISEKEAEKLELAADTAYAEPIIAYRPKCGGVAFKMLDGEEWLP